MQRFKKWFSVLLVMTFTFVSIIPPAGALAAPVMRPPVTPTVPGINPSGYQVREAPSTIGGVSYQFNPKVINLPIVPYTLEDIPDLSEIQGDGTAKSGGIQKPDIDKNLPATGLTPTGLPTAAVSQEIPVYAKNLVINRGFELTPKLGDIYFDPVTNAAFKVVGNASLDALGNQTIPVAEPGIDEVLQQFNVPHQTIPLTEGNIDFSSLPQGVEYEGVEIESERAAANATIQSSSNKNSNKGSSLDIKKEGKTYIFKLKNFVLYEYPDPKDAKAVEKAKKEAEKEMRESTDSYNWTGVSDKSNFGVKIKISEGTIKISDPKINFDASWDTLVSPYAKVHCSVDMNVDSNVLIEGNIKFKEERWQEIYGYYICDDPSDPKIKIYVGVFAVVGLDGKLTFRMRFQQVGKANMGVNMYFSSLIAPGVPLGIIPTGSFDPQEQSIGIIIDGDITAQAGVMAGFGIEIFKFKLLEVQVRLGVEGNCTFHIELGDTEGMKGGGKAASATFKLYFFIRVYADAFTVKKKDMKVGGKGLFELKFMLLDKTWSGSSGSPAGAGSEGVEKIRCRTDVYIDKADAAEDLIEGHVVIGDPPNQRPYQGPVTINVLLLNKRGGSMGNLSLDVTTDESGQFRQTAYLSPFDHVAAQVQQESDMEIYAARTKAIRTTVPYSIIEFEADAFNDLVYGTVSGEYTGPLSILVKRPGESTAAHQAYAIGGKFELPVQLIGGDEVNVVLRFEDMDIFALSGYKPANIDCLKLNLSPNAVLSAKNPNMLQGVTKGSISNTKGNTPYTGQVKLTVDRVTGLATAPIRMPLYSETQTAPPMIKESGSGLDQSAIGSEVDRLPHLPNAPEAPKGIERFLGGDNTSSNDKKAISSFSFDNTPIPAWQLDYTVEIVHDGLKKTETVYYEPEEGYVSHWQSHGFEQDPTGASPTQQLIDIRINPADMSGIQIRGIEVMNIPQELLLQGLQSVSQEQQQLVMNMPSQSFALKATGGDGYVNLEWKPAQGADIVGYYLYRGTSSGKYKKAPITDFAIEGTSYTDYNVKNGVTYYYIAKAVFRDNTESAPSNEVTVEPTQLMKSPVIKPPVINPPVINPPAVMPPVIEPPVTEPPTDEPPVIKPPVIKPPIIKP
jgi:hypothetical protein